MRALLVLAALVLALAGCGGADDQAAPPATTTDDASPPPSANRPAAPPIEGTTLDGEAVSLADFRGKPVLVNVWSSW